MTEAKKKAKAPASGTEHRIHITARNYVPVDGQGLWSGRYFEGALGCVVEALNVVEGAKEPRFQQLALKIPRLLADSDRENAYIEARFRDEVHAANSFISTTKLVSPKATMVLASGHRPNEQGARRIVLVRYEKGHAPRMCEATRDPKGNVRITPDVPEAIAPHPEALTELFAKLEAAPEPDTFICPTRTDAGIVGGGGSSRIRPLKEELAMQARDCPWYAFVPSILYTWYPQTLEQVLCQDAEPGTSAAGVHERMKLFEGKLELARSILEGVVELHGHQEPFLHNDIRSANVLVGSDRGVLGDYGSMSFSGPFAGPDAGAGSLESVELSPRRAAPYYAIERRSGREIESVNAACVQWCKATECERTGYVVVAGFQDDLFQTPGVPTELVKRVIAAAKPGHEGWKLDENLLKVRDTLDALKAGDRVRLRDLVFVVNHELTLVEPKGPKGLRIFVCEAPYSRLMHGNIPVRNRDEDTDADRGLLELRVPSLIELLQWSAASDLYSIGVITLDIAFRGGRSKQDRRNGPVSFEQMVRRMEDPAYFDYQWPRLDAVCRKLLEHETEGKSLQQLQREVQRVVSGIGGQTPHATELLANLDNNGAHFLLLLHFVLCCMHRTETYKDKASALYRRTEAGSTLQGPFCRDRCEPPNRGAAKNAFDFLVRVMDATRPKAPLSKDTRVQLGDRTVQRLIFWCDIGDYRGPEELNENVEELHNEVQALKKRNGLLIKALVTSIVLFPLAVVLVYRGGTVERSVSAAANNELAHDINQVVKDLDGLHIEQEKSSAAWQDTVRAHEAKKAEWAALASKMRLDSEKLFDGLDLAIDGLSWNTARGARDGFLAASKSWKEPTPAEPVKEPESLGPLLEGAKSRLKDVSSRLSP